jgi:hypothetical protein
MNLTFARAAALALAAVAVLASPGAAQGRSAEDTRTIDAYRLTMPVLRKVLPALYAPEGRSCPRENGRDPHSLNLAEMTRSLERCGPVLQSLKRAGVSARDAAIVFASLLRTGQQVAMQGGKASAMPPGVLRDNALLLEENDPEIRKLVDTGGQS